MIRGVWGNHPSSRACCKNVALPCQEFQAIQVHHQSPLANHKSPFFSAVPSAARCITFSSVASARVTSPVSRP
jgi:hypothetical protein